jgi:microcystin-dependent protein
MFYLADGATYRARLSSDDGGYVAYDITMEAVAPSGSGGGGGGGVAPEVLFQTGDLKQRLGSGSHPGFVPLNGLTIGNGTSGATGRANADTQALFEYLWGEFSNPSGNTVCVVTGGLGASATADYNAGKQLALIDGRGRTFFGADGMGTSRANRLTAATFATADTVGTTGGAEKHTLTEAELPEITPTFTGTPATITSTSTSSSVVSASSVVGISAGPGADATALGGSVGTGQVTSNASYTPSGSVSSFGSGQAFGTASPGFIGTWYVKL